MSHGQIRQSICSLCSISALLTSSALFAQQNDSTLETITVSARSQTPDQRHIQTGGDVTVLTHAEIEASHANTVAEAIQHIPGVHIYSSSYRAAEYGTSNDGDSITINGDRRVVILIDGRRTDNEASAYNYIDRSKGDLNNLTNIKNIERIEVIKGPNTLAYGADASGGVINIITRRGEKIATTVDLSLGSWNKRVINLNHQGSANGFRWIINAGREQSGNTKYKDAALDKVVKYYNTYYSDSNISAKLEKDFDQNQTLSLYYSHIKGRDHYPISAPDYIHPTPITPEYDGPWDNVFLKPGYRNEWWVDDNKNFDLSSNTANSTKESNDYDLKYTFYREADLESHIRVYSNNRKYETIWSPDNINAHKENTQGADLRIGKTINRHTLTSALEYRRSKYNGNSFGKYPSGTTVTRLTYKNRDSAAFFIQDKIALTPQWHLTPSFRYDRSSDSTQRKENLENGASTSQSNKRIVGNSSRWTKGLFSHYAWRSGGNIYASWSEVYNPVAGQDEADRAGEQALRPDQGDIFTIGFNQAINDATQIDLNYVYTDMDSIIARYSVYNHKEKYWGRKTINSWQKKKAFNISLSHYINDNWQMKLSYGYTKNRQQASTRVDDFYQDALINELQPSNTYRANINYKKQNWSAGIWLDIYSGLNKKYYTSKSFTVFGLNLNYDYNDNISFYLQANNIGNRAYETKGGSYYGPGSYPMPARNFLIGSKFSF